MSVPQQPALFDHIVTEIEAEYNSLGHTLGWRFLNVSRRVLDRPTPVAFITINPAGDHIPPDHPPASCEHGCSFLVERWGSSQPGNAALQVQTQLLFKGLAAQMRCAEPWQLLMEQSLISQFVPFRSPRFAALPRQAESLAFARRLWRRLLPATNPRIIVCLGREVQKELKQLLSELVGPTNITEQSYPTGWGNYHAQITVLSNAERAVRLLYLPHLSTWTLFTSEKCRAYMPAILEAIASDA